MTVVLFLLPLYKVPSLLLLVVTQKYNFTVPSNKHCIQALTYKHFYCCNLIIQPWDLLTVVLFILPLYRVSSLLQLVVRQKYNFTIPSSKHCIQKPYPITLLLP